LPSNGELCVVAWAKTSIGCNRTHNDGNRLSCCSDKDQTKCVFQLRHPLPTDRYWRDGTYYLTQGALANNAVCIGIGQGSNRCGESGCKNGEHIAC
jgi:hypothetical protein